MKRKISSALILLLLLTESIFPMAVSANVLRDEETTGTEETIETVPDSELPNIESEIEKFIESQESSGETGSSQGSFEVTDSSLENSEVTESSQESSEGTETSSENSEVIENIQGNSEESEINQETTETTESSDNEIQSQQSKLTTRSTKQKVAEMPIVSEQEYVTITNTYNSFWEDFTWKERGKSADYYGKVLLSKGYYEHENGMKYRTLYDNQDNWVGYINEGATKVVKNQVGFIQTENEYVTITNTYNNFWSDFTWEERGKSADYYGKVLLSKGYYEHYNGMKYRTLYDNQNNWVGYINEEATKLVENQVGFLQTENEYVAITNTYNSFWSDFTWKERGKSADYYGKVLLSKGYYIHYNGMKYRTLYDNQNNWVGYINEGATKVVKNQVGLEQTENEYVTITNKYNSFWSDFTWKEQGKSADYYGKVLLSKGYYVHYNGMKYRSLYDNQNKWIGYINEGATKVVQNQVGLKQTENVYVTITNKTNNFWSDFTWKERGKSADYYGKVLLSKGYYVHYNGMKYRTLYDSNNKWIGYINESATEIVKKQVGKYQSYGKYVTINSKDYTIWQNFDWKKKDTSTKHYNKTYLAKGYYNHYNGSRYLSLYNHNGKWIGYINEKATKVAPTVKSKMDKVQKLLKYSYSSSNYGIYVMSLVDGSVAQSNGNKTFHAASTGKLPAMYYTQKMINEKKLDGDKLYTYTDKINQMSNYSYMRGGAGILQGRSFGTKYSLNTMLNWTAKYSDNQGANFLGYYGANQYSPTMRKEISDVLGRTWTTPFYVSAKDNALLMQAIYNEGGKLITDLSNTNYDSQRIPKYLPVQVAHKIGDLEGIAHDAAIVFADQPYVIVVMTQYVGYEKISQLSKQVYDLLK